jgi:hypothetical protein
LKNKESFIRTNPENEKFKLKESPNDKTKFEKFDVIDNIQDSEAKNFWINFFGDNVEVNWNTFSGAYQTNYGRLGVTKTRGLKKLLCGDSEIINVFQFHDSIENFSEFPFTHNLLEKIEKYTELNSEEIPIDNFIDEETYNEARSKYLTMLMNYDKFERDLISNTTIDIENECVSVQIIQSGKIFSDALGYIIDNKTNQK